MHIACGSAINLFLKHCCVRNMTGAPTPYAMNHVRNVFSYLPNPPPELIYSQTSFFCFVAISTSCHTSTLHYKNYRI